MARRELPCLVGLALLCAASLGGCQVQSTIDPTEVLSTHSEGVVVATDKAAYATDEVVGITLRNELGATVWYARHVDCGAPFWVLQTCDGEAIQHHAFCVWEAPDHQFTSLAPDGELADQWDGTVVSDGTSAPAAPGCYRIMVPYSVDEPRPLGEDWEEKRIKAYSAPFQVS